MKAQPTILAFDTSAAHCVAALIWGDAQIATRFEAMARGQGERLMGLLEELLADEGYGYSDLDALAVGVGPGNFTGIRIAVSAARGLALGLGIPVISVSNFEIMRGPNSVTDLRGQLVSLPAPRGTNYIQVFDGGKAARAPQHVTVGSETLPALDLRGVTDVIGEHTADISRLNARTAHNATIPAIEREIRDVPETMVRIATDKWRAGQVDGTRPAPMYVRPADAAPPRDKPPVILP
jgi:tRNA threonylcarbamoyladenosine biosynthesis protein TsaB